MAGIVDVFAGAGEMHKFSGGQKLRARVEFGLEPVLHRFDIVVGGFFNLFDGLAVGYRKVFYQAQQVLACTGTEWFEFLKTRITERNKPGDFHLNAALHIAQFAHQRAQIGQLVGISSVQGRNRVDREEIHNSIVGLSPCIECPSLVGTTYTYEIDWFDVQPLCT